MLQKKVVLTEDEMPRQWYNILPDMPNGMLPPCIPARGSRWALMIWPPYSP